MMSVTSMSRDTRLNSGPEWTTLSYPVVTTMIRTGLAPSETAR